MSSLMIHDLASSHELDGKTMAKVRGGGTPVLGDFGKFANVNININQDIAQLQKVEVNALNNVGVIGSGFVPPNLSVSPSQYGSLAATV